MCFKHSDLVILPLSLYWDTSSAVPKRMASKDLERCLISDLKYFGIWKEQLLGKFHEISEYPLSSQLDRRVDMSTGPSHT